VQVAEAAHALLLLICRGRHSITILLALPLSCPLLGSRSPCRIQFFFTTQMAPGEAERYGVTDI
jgi:hypothetical protein